MWNLWISILIAMQAEGRIEPNPTTPPLRARHSHARMLTTMAGCVPPFYVWRNKNTILLFRGNEHSGSLSGVEQSISLRGIEQYHLDTRKRDALDAVNRRWQAHPLVQLDDESRRSGVAPASVDDATVSPDGKWMAWYAFGSGSEILMYFTLDGKEWRQRPAQQRDPNSVWQVVWSLDSRSWIGLLGYNQPAVIIHDVITQQERRYDFSSRVTLPQVQNTYWELLGQEANGHLLLILQKAGPHSNNDVLLADIPGETEQGDAKVLTIKMPPHAYSGKVTISPLGDRLAWILYFVPPDYEPGRPTPKSQQKQFHEEIWLSRPDGSDMHRLGDLILHENNKILGEYMGLWALQWSPDEKHISYLFDRVLYLVDVP
jgi:hypothetical protein